ncbi:putative oxidoreductase SadH [Botrimarina colliarenosi]|uniref:Putative oxidoreductase SadH n=1 Tax=Botrimarina colliarenosi TaxID=2528001 RepID=A0A5C6AJZ0_9BACT|nr:SDR family oxidoreductase [Botrimarina colliarenosi]TWT99730.1 putative oxidoreductase SadH [Botrimarina colliarenosi]
MRRLAGKTALVTGAARGIGRAIALRLAAKGVRLALVDRDAPGLAQTQRDAEQFGVAALSIPCDLTDNHDLEALAEGLLDCWAGVDVLVNNAGIAYYGPTHAMAPEDADEVLATNLHAPVKLTHALLPALLARPESHVLNVCSVLGLAVMPRVAVYCASKHALIGYSKALRVEYGRQGLGVTTLCPGFVRTALIEDATSSGRSMRRPPGVCCVSLDRVAHAAVRGIERNRRQVIVDPVGRWIRGTMAAAPGLFDWMHSLGKARRAANKRAELAALHPEVETALRLKLGRSAPPLQVQPPRQVA